MSANKLDTPYKPISCDLHSQYELAIMHKSQLCLTWIENNEPVTKSGLTPVDVQTKNKAEFLIAKTPGQDELVIRLDKITNMQILN